MKRKDWYTMIGAAIFVIVILVANMAVAQAHDGPEMAQYFQDLQDRQQLVDKGKGRKRKPPKPLFIRTMVASL